VNIDLGFDMRLHGERFCRGRLHREGLHGDWFYRDGLCGEGLWRLRVGMWWRDGTSNNSNRLILKLARAAYGRSLDHCPILGSIRLGGISLGTWVHKVVVKVLLDSNR